MNPSFIHGAAKTTQLQVNAYLSDLKSSTVFSRRLIFFLLNQLNEINKILLSV